MIKSMLILGSICVFAASLGFAAQNQSGGQQGPGTIKGTEPVAPQSPKNMFSKLDNDKDGYVSWEELHASYPEVKEAQFKEADQDRNGKLDHNEWYNLRHKYGPGLATGAGSGKAK